MRGRFIVDLHPLSDALYITLEEHTVEDIADTVEVGNLVMCYKNREGTILAVEIILPAQNRTSGDDWWKE